MWTIIAVIKASAFLTGLTGLPLKLRVSLASAELRCVPGQPIAGVPQRLLRRSRDAVARPASLAADRSRVEEGQCLGRHDAGSGLSQLLDMATESLSCLRIDDRH